MSWETLNSKQSNTQEQLKHAENKKQELIDLANAYSKCFRSEPGQKVLADLTNKFIYNNEVQTNEVNIEFVAGLKQGESNVVKYLVAGMTRAEKV